MSQAVLDGIRDLLPTLRERADEAERLSEELKTRIAWRPLSRGGPWCPKSWPGPATRRSAGPPDDKPGGEHVDLCDDWS